MRKKCDGIKEKAYWHEDEAVNNESDEGKERNMSNDSCFVGK